MLAASPSKSAAPYVGRRNSVCSSTTPIASSSNAKLSGGTCRKDSVVSSAADAAVNAGTNAARVPRVDERGQRDDETGIGASRVTEQGNRERHGLPPSMCVRR